MHRFVVMMGMMTAAPAWAQQVPAPTPNQAPAAPAAAPDEEDEPLDIVVTGSRQNLPGAVVGDIPPELQLGPADIRSYGVSSVSDLLDELGPQTQSGVGGPPVVLLNGRRIANFSEIRDLPTEAILRVDILPEEVALKYGYRADQKVVNFVLRRRFRAIALEAADKVPTEGGSNTAQGEFDLLHINRDGRLNLHLKYLDTSPLTEAERGVIQQPAPINQGPYRTLIPGSHNFSANLVYARPIGKASATVNGTLTQTGSEALLGLPDTPLLPGIGSVSPLTRTASSLTAHLGTTVNGDAGQWRWTLTGTYDRTASDTYTETGFDPAQPPLYAGNIGHSTSSEGELQALVNGPAFQLPAGPVSTTIRIGADTSDFSSRSYRTGLTQIGDVSRDTASGQVNVDLPITSRSKDVLGWAGNFSLNGNVGVDRLSDFGTLVAYGYGFNWSVIGGVRVIGSVAHRDEAPTAAQLGNPLLTTPNTRVFDYVTGQTVNVTALSGGNPFLRSDTKNVQKIGVTLKPWAKTDLTVIANYVKTTVDDPVASFPTPTAAIEAAFPDRFVRDAGGNLLRLDTRPLNYARTENSQIRYGFNFSKSLKSKTQREMEAFRAGTGPNPFAGMTFPGRQRRQGGRGGDAAAQDNPGQTPPAEGAAPPPPGDDRQAGGGRGPGGRGGGRGGFGGRGGGGGGRLQFALYHTIHLTDRVDVLNGGPSLDLLRGDAIGQSGGQPRHEVEGQAGYTNNGIGARLSANWQSGTTVQAGSAANPQTLAFSDLATFNLRLFADLGGRLDWVKAHPWMRGTRVSLSFNNLTNERQRVTDANGLTPISYQPAFLDALGRSVRLSVRKLF